MLSVADVTDNGIGIAETEQASVFNRFYRSEMVSEEPGVGIGLYLAREVMKAQDGDVVLLHDIHEYNVDAVKRFVPDLIAEGFQLVTVPELYEARGETLEAGTVHYRTDPTTQAGTETAPAASTDSAAESTTASE